jgi:CRP-like cAMP-binding protein
VSWVRHRPDAAVALLETLALRLRRTDEALADLTFLDVPHRLARQLVRMAAADPLAQASGDSRLKITQAELASMLGVSRESVNKQLNRFVRDGWVSLGRGWVRLENVEALRTFD